MSTPEIYRTPEIDLDDRLRWLAMDIENLRWRLAETKYIDDDILVALKKRVDIIIENNNLVRERLNSGENENNR